MDVWKKFKFSVDLINGALNEIHFLKEINDSPLSSNDELLDRAVYRYEKIWLPFCAHYETNLLSPPLDIEWIWHCHMLSHSAYKQDCFRLLGKLLDHQVITKQERYQRENITYQHWSMANLGVSFNYLDSKSVDSGYKHYKTGLMINLKEVAKRQLEFFYQVSLPHFQNIEYLRLGFDRYEKFLYLKKRNPSMFIVPCYSIYLIWHTHQLTPSAFDIDTQKIFGQLFNNRDTTNRIDYWTKLTKVTWEKTFGEEYFFPGSMNRGSSLPRSIDCIDFIDTFDKFSYKHLRIEIKDLKFEIKTEQHSFLVEFVLKFNETSNETSSIRRVWRPVFTAQNRISSKCLFIKLDDYRNKYKNLKMEIKVFHAQKPLSKVFAFIGKNSDALSSLLVESDLTKPIELIKINHNDFILDLKLSLIQFKKPHIYFEINKKNDFSECRMNQIKNDYKAFDLQKSMYKSTEESAVRVKHKLCADLGRNQFNHKDQSFEFEILHIFSKSWSSIGIFRNDNQVAMSHLIGLEHLPGLYQLPENSFTYDENDLCESKLGYLILDDRYEKAMLVRNVSNGDYAIIKGKWIGKSNSVPGSTGHLILSHYLISTKQTQRVHISKKSQFSLASENCLAHVNMKSGLIQINQIKQIVNCLEVESLIACVFSVAVLNVVLQPRLNDGKPGSISWTNMDEYRMLNSIANYGFIRSGRFTYGLLGYDGCDNGFESGDGNEYVGSIYGRGETSLSSKKTVTELN